VSKQVIQESHFDSEFFSIVWGFVFVFSVSLKSLRTLFKKKFILFICAYYVWVISPPFSPHPPPPLPSPYPSLPGRNYFALISNFDEERV
jgi:hypothetical protein